MCSEREGTNGDGGTNGNGTMSDPENQQNLAPPALPPSSSSNSGLMTLSDEDSIDPSYVVSPTSAASHLAMGFKQEPLLEPDPRFA